MVDQSKGDPVSLTADLAVETRPAPDLQAFDHLEWWVGNARHSAHYWASAFGFEIEAYAGPETGLRDRQSYVVTQGDLRFVLTSSLDDGNEIARFVAEHGDGVRDVAYTVGDAEQAYGRACARGAIGVVDPSDTEDHDGVARRATVAAYGETRHSFVERAGYRGPFLPGYERVDLAVAPGAPVGLHHADHVVANVAAGDLDEWVEWYEQVFGFRRLQQFDADAISTEYSALRSTVVWNGGSIVQPINEPAAGRRKSQIEEYLDYFGCPGVQHVAMHTDDILGAVASMRRRGVRCMRVPDTYYDDAPGRLADLGVELPWDRLAELGILVDRDADGYLLQIFTEPVASRPTAFMEVIHRAGAKGFGEGNFKALFESIEVEQARRGNL
jgi:4-hydroxyphenylpyruvate dioxygenase